MPDFDNGKTDFFEETGFGQTWPTQQGLNDGKASMRTDICSSSDCAPGQKQKPGSAFPTIFSARTENI